MPRIAVGILGGLVLATGLSLWVTAVRIIAGPSAFEEMNTTYLAVVLTYYAGGIGGGGVFGLLLPLARTLWGTVLLGYLAALPTVVGIRIATDGFSPWTMPDTVALVFTPLIGALVAYNLWRSVHD